MSKKPQTISDQFRRTPRLNLPPNDPRVTEAILQRIREMSIEELDAFLAYRSPEIIANGEDSPMPDGVVKS